MSQQSKLKITSLDKHEKEFLKKIDYKKTHKDLVSVYSEIERIIRNLKNIGYFRTSFDSINKSKTTSTAFLSLKNKINNAILSIENKDSIYYNDYDIKNNTINIKINKLQSILKKTTQKLDKEGKPLSKVKLSNIVIKDKTLFATLEIKSSEQRKINKTIVKGYRKFPKSFLKNYFNIYDNSFLEKKRLAKIAIDTKNLSFIKEIKSPEVLFTKDSTLLYLYFSKKSNNSIDALISFATLENGNILFNGNFDLKLKNILNKGESFQLFWNRIAEERQEFNITTNLPYLFNSKITTELIFNIYRQDSSFTNTKFNTSLNYNINSKLNLGLVYSTENSESLKKNKSEIPSFKNNFLGIQLNYIRYNDNVFQDKKLFLKINSSTGKRKSEQNNSNQLKINFTGSYLWELNKRNFIFLKNNTSFLNSDQYFNNELFRIGGANSIRGFNEQSIFTKNHTYFNFEYRFLTSTNSYLYSITDFGIINNNNEQLLGFGLGYKFKNKNSLINIGIANGFETNNRIDLNNSKLIFSWVNYF